MTRVANVGDRVRMVSKPRFAGMIPRWDLCIGTVGTVIPVDVDHDFCVQWDGCPNIFDYAEYRFGHNISLIPAQDDWIDEFILKL